MDELITTILTSAVVSSIATTAISSWLESRKSKVSTKLEALKASVELEGYAINCADKLANHELAISSAGHAGAFLADVPDIPPLNIAVGFLRPKKYQVANRLLIFPQEHNQAKQVVLFMWDVTCDPDSCNKEAAMQTAKMGLKAVSLAEDLRNAFKLPDRELVFGTHDIKETLKDNIEKTGA